MPVSSRPLRMLVDPPNRVPMPYGLFTVAQPRSDGDQHWRAGVEWMPLCGGAGTTIDFMCVSGAPNLPFVDTGGRDFRGALPFTVFSEIDCAPVGDTWNQAYIDVTNLLQTTEEFQVERAFWTGQAAGFNDQVQPHLAANTAVVTPVVVGGLAVTMQTAAVVVSGGPQTMSAGIGMLEGALAACYVGAGVIHVPQAAIPQLAFLGMIYRDGKNLRTYNGNLVIAGAGYPGTSPSGAAPPTGTTWIYATGQMFIYRGDITTFTRESSLNRTNNTFKAVAQRTYVLGWDCCHFAVQVNVG
jgi:hypothetical protein